MFYLGNRSKLKLLIEQLMQPFAKSSTYFTQEEGFSFSESSAPPSSFTSIVSSEPFELPESLDFLYATHMFSTKKT